MCFDLLQHRLTTNNWRVPQLHINGNTNESAISLGERTWSVCYPLTAARSRYDLRMCRVDRRRAGTGVFCQK